MLRALSVQAAATEFVENFARTFDAKTSYGANTASSEWELVPDQQSAYTFKAAGEAEGKLRPFACTINWAPSFAPSMVCKFPVVPGLSSGFLFRLPPAACGALSVTVKVDTAAVKQQSFQVRALMRKVVSEDGGSEEGGGGGGGGGCGVFRGRGEPSPHHPDAAQFPCQRRVWYNALGVVPFSLKKRGDHRTRGPRSLRPQWASSPSFKARCGMAQKG